MLERLLRACDQELEPVGLPRDRDFDRDEIDDQLDMSPAERALYAAAAGRRMLQFTGAPRPGSTSREPTFDPITVLRTLATRSVDFVVVGGFAAALRGSPVTTDDVDICFAQEEANRRRLADALIALAARTPGVDVAATFIIEDALELREQCSFDTVAGRVDTVAVPRGTNGYVDLVRGADRLDIEECFVLVASLDDLVRMKAEGADEPQWISLSALRAVRRRLEVAYR